MKPKASTLIRSILIEAALYSILVVLYFFLTLHLLGGWLTRLFDMPSKVVYAIVALGLMSLQGVLLEAATTWLLRFVRRTTE